MASTRAIADPHASKTITSKLRDYYTLTKPEVNLLILMTTSAGYYLGSQGPLRPGRLFLTLVGTLLVASGTATLNQLMERLYDAQMRRTANRPLVSGRLSAKEACWFGLSLSVAGGVSLAVCGQRGVGFAGDRNPSGISAGLYAAEEEDAAVHVAGRCTWRHAYPHRLGGCIRQYRAKCLVPLRSPLSVAVPSFPGDRADVPRRLRAGRLSDVASVRSDGRFTKAEIVVFTLVLVLVTMLPLAGRSGATYSLIMFTAGAFFLYHTANLAKSGSNMLASRVVHASVIYLPVVLGTMMAWKA